MAIDPANGDVWIATPDGVFTSSDGGASWSAAGTGLPDSRIMSLVATNGRVFVGTGDAGVWRTTDAGQTWQVSGAGSGDLEIVLLAADPNQPARIWAGTGGSGLLVFASTDDGLFRSVDGSANWPSSGAGLGGVDVTDLLPADGRWWAATDNGVFVSDDDGSSWTVPGTVLALPVLAIAWDPRPDHWLAAGTEGGGVMILASDGSWSVDDPALAAETVEAIAFATNSTGYAGGVAGTWVENGEGPRSSWERCGWMTRPSSGDELTVRQPVVDDVEPAQKRVKQRPPDAAVDVPAQERRQDRSDAPEDPAAAASASALTAVAAHRASNRAED